MKLNRSILLVSMICTLTACLQAQRSEWNLDFEEWDLSNTTAELWHDTTVIENRVGLFPPKWHYRPDHIPEGTGLGRTTDAAEGEYALTMSGFYQYPVMRIISGDSAGKPGWPIDYKPDKLVGDYKAILLGNKCDSLRVYVDAYLTKYDPGGEKRDTIGNGSIVLRETSDIYQRFELDIDYDAGGTSPDSMIIVLAKERFGFDVPPACLECSHVFFDNLQLPNVTSTADQKGQKLDICVFPNPGIGDVVVVIEDQKNALNITLVDAHGQPLKRYHQVRSGVVISGDVLDNGIYFLIVEDTAGKLQRCEKLVIKKGR